VSFNEWLASCRRANVGGGSMSATGVPKPSDPCSPPYRRLLASSLWVAAVACRFCSGWPLVVVHRAVYRVSLPALRVGGALPLSLRLLSVMPSADSVCGPVSCRGSVCHQGRPCGGMCQSPNPCVRATNLSQSGVNLGGLAANHRRRAAISPDRECLPRSPAVSTGGPNVGPKWVPSPIRVCACTVLAALPLYLERAACCTVVVAPRRWVCREQMGGPCPAFGSCGAVWGCRAD